MMSMREGEKCEIRVDVKIGWVEGCVSYASTTGGHYIVDTEKYGRFAVSPDHDDLRKAGS